MKDRDVTDSIKADSFHTGLAEHGEFLGFEDTIEDERAETRRGHVEAMTDEEIKASRSKLARLVRNPQLLLTLVYVGTILLMGKVYA